MTMCSKTSARLLASVQKETSAVFFVEGAVPTATKDESDTRRERGRLRLNVAILSYSCETPSSSTHDTISTTGDVSTSVTRGPRQEYTQV
jgi:hypothetical protein